MHVFLYIKNEPSKFFMFSENLYHQVRAHNNKQRQIDGIPLIWHFFHIRENPERQKEINFVSYRQQTKRNWILIVYFDDCTIRNLFISKHR
jgi:hypothetical protein